MVSVLMGADCRALDTEASSLYLIVIRNPGNMALTWAQLQTLADYSKEVTMTIGWSELPFVICYIRPLSFNLCDSTIKI